MNGLVEVQQRTMQVSAAVTPVDLLRHAMDSGADLDRLEKLMELQARYEANEARKAYVDGMAQFKLNPPSIVKDKEVAFSGTRYSHATLGAVTQAVAAGLAQHGFSHRWDTAQENGQITVSCIITHRLGHSESIQMTARPDDSGKKNAIQQVASAITYLQRYTLMAATGVAAMDESDDDGRAAQLDTSLADEWIAKVNAAPTDADVLKVWEIAAPKMEKRPRDFEDFEKAVIERRTVLAKGAK